jgi:hypothetical protein
MGAGAGPNDGEAAELDDVDATIEVVMTGTGSDTVIGSERDDEVRTGSGDDVVRTLGGRDTVEAGLGADHVELGDGDDTLLDIQYFPGIGPVPDPREVGGDVIDGGAGNDTINVPVRAASVVAGSGRDRIFGIGAQAHVDVRDGERDAFYCATALPSGHLQRDRIDPVRDECRPHLVVAGDRVRVRSDRRLSLPVRCPRAQFGCSASIWIQAREQPHRCSTIVSHTEVGVRQGRRKRLLLRLGPASFARLVRQRSRRATVTGTGVVRKSIVLLAPRRG